MDALFAHTAQFQMVTTFLGYAETFSLLLRKQNRGDISTASFRIAASSLQAETLTGSALNILSITDSDILYGVEFMRRYNINASDAAILVAFLRYSRSQLFAGSPCILVAADQRLLRAASAEGLATLNPETVSAAAVPALLAAL